MIESSSNPLPVVRGERVYLRAADRQDLPSFVRWFNDAETMSFIAQRMPMSQSGEEMWFNDLLAHQGKDRFHFAICRLEDSRLIGVTDFFAVDMVNGNAGIGITIGESELRGQGYGTDAMNALLDFGFGQLRLERLWLEVYDFNARGRRSYEKAGFTLEGVQRHAIFKNGRYVDVHLMSILREEWSALPRKKIWDYSAEQ